MLQTLLLALSLTVHGLLVLHFRVTVSGPVQQLPCGVVDGVTGRLSDILSELLPRLRPQTHDGAPIH
jgi:hypothetical protein